MPWPFLKIGGRVREAPPPEGINDNLSYEDKPGAHGSEAAYWKEGDVPDLKDPDFPSVPMQDKILVHWLRPPGDVNPQAWYDDRNPWALRQRQSIEKQSATPWHIQAQRDNQPAPDPRWTPPETVRYTSNMSPTSYLFTRPYDQDIERENNGVHLSLADNRRAYMLGGSAGTASAWNNSYRLDPPNNDATAVFVGDTVHPDVGAQMVVSRTMDVWAGRSYRLT